MRMTLILTAVVAAVYPVAAWPQDDSASPDVSYELPQACKDAAGYSEAPKMGVGMSGMEGMSAMDEVQTANMGAMMMMGGPMMQATMIKDPDMAFNCGMIVHHQGGIAMGEVELRLGRDEASRETARMIIAAQGKEIEKMTARVEALAKRD